MDFDLDSIPDGWPPNPDVAAAQRDALYGRAFANLLLQLFQRSRDALFTLCDVDGITLTNIPSGISQPSPDFRLL